VVTAEQISGAGFGRVAGPRQSDGSLPEFGFMRSETTSRLINAGIAVDVPFKGSAPDPKGF